MTIATQQRAQIATCLEQFDFRRLFIEELGWNRYRESLTVDVDATTYTLRGVAEKKSVVVLVCDPDSNGGIPNYVTRKQIDDQVTKSAHEHLIIFVDAQQTHQSWLWVRRKQGQRTAYRGEEYSRGQSGERLIQKLQQIAIDMADEETLSLIDVMLRLEKGFDVERVTKKFYDRFQIEHRRFEQAITGIADEEMRRWYASLMLNRLMFTYFIQGKKFLDGNPNYLSDRLAKVQALGRDRFHSFYRGFLLHLFHDGLGKPLTERQLSPDLAALIGNVPYLNGGLFEVHQIEQSNRAIEIPDSAFQHIFVFFDEYDWRLDDRPLRNDKEINPDVLGYIFEKYINQKQMGAYYTKEDITGYIGRNTTLPFLFDQARARCAVAFQPDGEVWRLLRDDPDRYIYTAVRQGVDEPLPAEIAAGVSNVSQRAGWNRPASAPFALPSETWREHVARRTRCVELRERLAAGEVTQISALITYNLDVEQFARDVIERCEGPDLLRAFWQAITSVTVLDPTCGSGAFLFAALNILEPLYEACLTRMQAFLNDFDRSGEPQKGQDFRAILAGVSQHPNRRYFILKSIIINNLYGVDIMEEACEIAKLRLFLALVAEVDDAEKLEPLPDVDFNIRAGNTLVGFTTLNAVRQAMTFDVAGRTRKLLLDPQDEAALASIEAGAASADVAYRRFREMQSEHVVDVAALHAAKGDLRQRLNVLRDTLDRYLAREYGIAAEDDLFAFTPWRTTHQPLHWFVEFYGIVQGRGGFDVVVGNPPYVEYSKVRGSYTIKNSAVEPCGNLYAFILERCFHLLEEHGRFGMIIPVSLLCTERMIPLQALVLDVGHSWASSFDMRPSSLFYGVSQRLAILITSIAEDKNTIHLGGYRRWSDEERGALLTTQRYVEYPTASITLGYMPKIAEHVERSIATKVQGAPLAAIESTSAVQPIYVHRIVRYFVKALDFIPHFWNEADGNKKSEDYKPFTFVPQLAAAVGATINSSTFYWFWHSHSDGFHCGYRDVRAFGLNHTLAPDAVADLTKLHGLVMAELKNNATRRVVYSRTTGRIEYDEIYSKPTKPIIDEIDRVLARHYSFTDEELDFIINYDIKYRMGQDSSDEGEGEE